MKFDVEKFLLRDGECIATLDEQKPMIGLEARFLETIFKRNEK